MRFPQLESPWDSPRSVITSNARMPEDDRSDFELLDAWGTGDKSAANDLVKRYHDYLLGWFRSKVMRDAEDLFQDTFLRFVEKRSRFRRLCSFRTYLFAIARRVLLEESRRKGRSDEPFISTTHVPEQTLLTAGSMLALKDELRVVLHAIRGLPLEQQDTLYLHFIRELPANQCAEKLGVAEGTVRSRLARGREHIELLIKKIASGDFHPSSEAELDGWHQECLKRLRDEPEASGAG